MKRWKVEVRKAYFHINLSKAEIRKAFRRTLRWRPWTLLDDAALPTVAVMSKHPNDGQVLLALVRGRERVQKTDSRRRVLGRLASPFQVRYPRP